MGGWGLTRVDVKAFVTGATGFIGRQLVSRLRQDGADVIVLVRKESPDLPAGTVVVKGDLLDTDSLKDAGCGCDRLYHLAGLVTFDPRRREELLRVNGEGTRNILEAAKRWGVARCVAVSSACTIGLSVDPGRILDETAPLDPVLLEANPYLYSKQVAEAEARRVANELPVAIVNPTTVYGPGDWSMNSGSLIRQVARSRLVPIPPGGSNVVDVADVVDGILAAGERGRSGERYILGGENLAFARIMRAVSEALHVQPLFLPVPRWSRGGMSWLAGVAGRFGDSRFLTPQIVSDLFLFKFYSSRRATEELGYRPRFSFSQSVERALEFYRTHHLLT
jgi:dihydroflavonol-4-reductase